MNRQIKVILAIFISCMLAVVANLAWVQIFGAEGIRNNAYNKRRMVEEYAIQRGDIITADMQTIARSERTGTEYEWQRVYPLGPLFADVTGYDSWRYGRSGLELAFNEELLGKGDGMSLRGLANRMVGTSRRGDSLLLTLDSGLQRVASEALGDRKGAVVALDPRTGAVLAMVTSPTFDPNSTVPLPGRDTEAAWAELNSSPDRPLFNRVTSGLYPPGSSFKTVVAAAALQVGVVTPETSFDCTGRLNVRGFNVYDFGRSSHGSISFASALVVSCNITFAQLGLRLGGEALVQYSEAFGFGSPVPFDIPTAASRLQDAAGLAADPVALATASFGQGRDLATPLQMALVAGAIANDGTLMQPYLVDQVQDYNGRTVRKTSRKPLSEVVGPATADVLTGLMVDAVAEGTGTAARIRGVPVAGKTGTAEVEGAEPHAWFICFAPAGDPRVAISVIVENGGEGGRTAAPIARQVLQRALGIE